MVTICKVLIIQLVVGKCEQLYDTASCKCWFENKNIRILQEFPQKEKKKYFANNQKC